MNTTTAEAVTAQEESRRRIVRERNGVPSWTDLGDGYVALHIQYGGNAVIVRVGGGNGPPGSGDIAAFHEWLDYVSAALGARSGS